MDPAIIAPGYDVLQGANMSYELFRNVGAYFSLTVLFHSMLFHRLLRKGTGPQSLPKVTLDPLIVFLLEAICPVLAPRFSLQ